LVVATGCSFIAVRPSPAVNPQTGVGACATPVLPSLDLVGALGLVFFGVDANAGHDASHDCGSHPEQSICHDHWVAYVPAGIAVVSAIYGYWALHDCEKTLDAMHKHYLENHPGKSASAARRDPVLPRPGIGR
jgi:hypothetical protein